MSYLIKTYGPMRINKVDNDPRLSLGSAPSEVWILSPVMKHDLS